MEVDLNIKNKILALELIQCAEISGNILKEKYESRKVKKMIALLGGLLRFEKNPFLKNKKIKLFNKAFLCIYPSI